MIAFGSVVTQSVPAGRIAGGNPARDLAPVPDAPGFTRALKAAASEDAHP